MQRVAILFADFGPYHVARIDALASALQGTGAELCAFRFTKKSGEYGWRAEEPQHATTITLARELPNGMAAAFRLARAFFRELRARNVEAVFLPTYSPLPNLLCFLAAKAAGCRTILMTESWHGTESASLPGKIVKHVLVRMFDSALVGGRAQRDYVVAYGMSGEKVFMGYDVVDVAAFARRADEFRAAAKRSRQLVVGSSQLENDEKTGEVRSMERTLSSQRSQSRGSKEQDRPEAEHLSTLNPKPSTEQSLRSAYGLPERYFLNLGRFVEKKNLATLVSAYARYAGGVAVAGKKLKVKGEKQGAGSMEHGARETADGGDAAATSKTRHSSHATRHRPASLVLVGEGPLRGDLEGQARELGLAVRDGAADRNPSGGPEVVFYPFQQANLTPLFFARSEAFILPSTREEWGLVVNEAMACSVPVLVSNRVGAHFDLVEEGVNGFTFEPMDVAGLAELLGRFDAEDGLGDRLGAAGRRRIEEWSPDRFGREGLRALAASMG